MKPIQSTIYLLLTSFFIASFVQAHDPSEHIKKNEAPKCESMKAMDHSKMDANDPIMMAMMKKCNAQGQNHHEAMEMDHSNMEMDHNNKKTANKAANGHHHHN